jgi:hypothetical protein
LWLVAVCDARWWMMIFDESIRWGELWGECGFGQSHFWHGKDWTRSLIHECEQFMKCEANTS